MAFRDDGLLGQIVQELVDGDVKFVVVYVGAVLNLCFDRGNFVGADVVGLQGLEQMAGARELETIAGASGARLLSRELLLDGVLDELLDRRAWTDVVHIHGRLPVGCWRDEGIPGPATEPRVTATSAFSANPASTHAVSTQHLSHLNA